MRTVTDLYWTGECDVTVEGHDYHCELDCDVQACDCGSEHDYIVSLDQFEAYNAGSQNVIEPQLRWKIRKAIVSWIADNQDKIVRTSA